MWDYTDIGSGANDDDPYKDQYWTLYYDTGDDRLTGVRIDLYFYPGEFYDKTGYTEEYVQDYVTCLQNEVYNTMPFVSVTMEQEEDHWIVHTYFQGLDDQANRVQLANMGILCMQVDWGTTIGDAVETVKSLNGKEV